MTRFNGDTVWRTDRSLNKASESGLGACTLAGIINRNSIMIRNRWFPPLWSGRVCKSRLRRAAGTWHNDYSCLPPSWTFRELSPSTCHEFRSHPCSRHSETTKPFYAEERVKKDFKVEMESHFYFAIVLYVYMCERDCCEIDINYDAININRNIN